MRLELAVEVSLESIPHPDALRNAFGQAGFLDRNRELAAFLERELGMDVRFVECRVSQLMSAGFPITVHPDIDAD